MFYKVLKNMEVITTGFPTDDQIGLDSAILTYYQNADCTEDRDEFQEITVSSRNNGIANFINIKTDNWSISGIEDLQVLIEDFKTRTGLFDDE